MQQQHLFTVNNFFSALRYTSRIMANSIHAGAAVAIASVVVPYVDCIIKRCMTLVQLQPQVITIAKSATNILIQRITTYPSTFPIAVVCGGGAVALATRTLIVAPYPTDDSPDDDDSSSSQEQHQDDQTSESDHLHSDDDSDELAEHTKPRSQIDDDTHSDDHDDPDSIWTRFPEKHQRAPLSAEEVKQHSFSFEAEMFGHWFAELATFLEMRHPQAACLLRLSCDDAAELVLRYESAAQANTWLAAALRALCDKTHKRAELFIQELMEEESEEPGVSTSGIDIAERIRSEVNERDTSEQEQEWTKLKSGSYLKVGMSDVDVRLAIRKIASRMRVCPVYRREAPHALMRLVVDMIPSQPPALADQKKKYLAAFDRAERLREPPTLESKPLDLKRLTEWIVVDIAQHSTPAQRHEHELCSAERREQRWNEKSKHHKGPCSNCGGTHHWTHCTATPCTRCNRRWCQGTWHMQCFGELDDPPEYIDKLGQKLPINLQLNMNQYRKAHGKRIAEVSNLEIPADTANDNEPESFACPGLCFACEDGLPIIVESPDEASILEVVPAQHFAVLINSDCNHDCVIDNHDHMTTNPGP